MKSVKLKSLSFVARALTFALFCTALSACVVFASTSEEGAYALAEPNSGPDDNDSESNTPANGDCADTPWEQVSCQEGAQIYDVTFNGIEVATMEEYDISLTDVHCAGFDSVILFAGDTS